MLLGTAQTLVAKNTPTPRFDWLMWTVSLTIILLLIEAILAAGTGAGIKVYLDSMTPHWPGNAITSIIAAGAMGATLITVDLAAVVVWIGGLIRHQKRSEPSQDTSIGTRRTPTNDVSVRALSAIVTMPSAA